MVNQEVETSLKPLINPFISQSQIHIIKNNEDCATHVPLSVDLVAVVFLPIARRVNLESRVKAYSAVL